MKEIRIFLIYYFIIIIGGIASANNEPPSSFDHTDKEYNLKVNPFSLFSGYHITLSYLFDEKFTADLCTSYESPHTPDPLGLFDPVGYYDKESWDFGLDWKVYNETCVSDSYFVGFGLHYYEEGQRFYSNQSQGGENSSQWRIPTIMGYQWVYDSGINWSCSMEISLNVNRQTLSRTIDYSSRNRPTVLDYDDKLETNAEPKLDVSVGYMF